MPEVVLPPYLQSVLALRPPLATSTRTDLAPSFKLLHATVNLIYGVSGIRGLEPGLWRAQLIRVTLRSAQLIEAVWTKLGGPGGVIIDDQGQGGRGVMKLQGVFSDLSMFIGSLTTLQDPLSALLLDPVAFSRAQTTVTSLSKKLAALIEHYNVADLLPTPLDQWPEEDAQDKDEDLAALPVLIAKSRPTKAVLQTFQDQYAERDQAELSSSINVDDSHQVAQPTSNPLSSSTSSVISPASSSYANPGLSTVKRSDFLRFVYTQNPNLIGNKTNLDAAVAAGAAAVSSMTFSSKVSPQSLSRSHDGHKARKSLVQQRISSFATSTDTPPPLPSSTLGPLNSPRRVVSDNPNNGVPRKSWTVDMSGLNGIQRKASLSSSKPSSRPAASSQIMVAAPQTSWKSSASRPASINSRSSSFTGSVSCSRSSSGEIVDLKQHSTHLSQVNSIEPAATSTSAEYENSTKGPPTATFAEQAAAIVAARKQRAISQSCSSSILSKDRHFTSSQDHSTSSNALPVTIEYPTGVDMEAASESSVVAIPSSKPHAVPTSANADTPSELSSSLNSHTSEGSGSVPMSISVTNSADVTAMLPADTTLTIPSSSGEHDSSSLSNSPTKYSKVDSMPPSTTVSFTSGSSITSMLHPDSSKQYLNSSMSASNSSGSHSSPASLISHGAFGPSVARSEPDSNFELVPDLIEHTSMLDVILTPTEANYDDSSKKSATPVESVQTLSTVTLVSPPRSPNQPSHFPKPSSSQAPSEELSLVALMEQASLFEDWTPDQEHAAEKSRVSTSSISSTVHPKAPNDSEPTMVSRTASFSLSHHGSTWQSPPDSSETNSELLRSSSATPTPPVSPQPSSMSLRPIDSILTSLPEGNHSSALLSLAGSASSTPSTSAHSWATSFISTSTMPIDLDWHLLNGNYYRDQPFVPPPFNPHKSGWRILCLDGGGVRGLSMLYLVRELMLSIKTRLRLERTPLPCEIFEMICGVGTGGIIALLLGRLRLDVSIAIPAYLHIVRQVFGHSKGVMATVRRTTRFSASRLEAVIKEVVNRISGNSELALADEGTGSVCRTFVISMRSSENKGERGSFIKLRSYSQGPTMADTCSIAQAARATSAAPLFFKPSKLNDDDNRTDSVPTDTTVHNPCLEAVTEAQTLLPGRPIDCLISLGAGSGIDPGSGSIARACSEMLESCERTAHEVELKSRQAGWSDNYFRLAVKGLKNQDNRGEWLNPDLVKAVISRYTCVEEQEKFNKQVEILSNSWKSAYEDEMFSSLMKVENGISTTPHSAIFPVRNEKLTTDQLRRTVSQIEFKFEEKKMSFDRSSSNRINNSSHNNKVNNSSINYYDNNLDNGVSVKTNPTNSSNSSFLLDLKLPEFDFSKV